MHEWQSELYVIAEDLKLDLWSFQFILIPDLDDEFLILTLHMDQHSLIHSMKWCGCCPQAQIMIGQNGPSILYFCCTINM
jgi:hypothetical protein